MNKSMTATEIQLGTVGLKVADLEKQIDFYTQIIGLELLRRNENQAVLGLEDGTTELLQLKKIGQPASERHPAGLYHTAFLLPERKDLGNTLFSLLTKEAPISGAADHGYSEAIYLTDPEGNGIEIYRDKPMTEWGIQADGRIAGTTAEMDAEGVLAARDEKTDKFPAGTTVGHVHLSVSDLEQTELFYTEVLGLSLKDRFGKQANFFAAGDYHHHIGTNVWQGTGLPAPTATDLGLAYFTVLVPDRKQLNAVEARAEENGALVTVKSEGTLELLDPSGITVKVTVRH